MIQNKLRVLLQRVRNGNRVPAKIILPTAWYDMLDKELNGAIRQISSVRQGLTFQGVPIIVDKDLKEPLVLLESKDKSAPKDEGIILPGQYGQHMPKWKKD